MKKISLIFASFIFVSSAFPSTLDVAISELESSRVREVQFIERKAQSDLIRCSDVKCRDEVTIEKYKALSELNERAYLYLKNLIQK